MFRFVRMSIVTDISLANSIKKLGYEFEWIKDASDFDKAEVRLLCRAGQSLTNRNCCFPV